MSAATTDTLALFDLDHTLIPFDSGMAWTRFLVERGVLSADAEARYLAYCHQYVAGTLDIHAMHRACLRPLLGYPRAMLTPWLREFEAAMAPRLPSGSRELLRRHSDAGDLCVIVTATERFIAEPFARQFGVEHLIATDAATIDGVPGSALTGEIDGEPCYREHKVTLVNRWLARRPADSPTSIDGFATSWFYSDSVGDLALLGAVTNPVVVRPDERLRAHARAAGWPSLDLD
ncbi:MAG TPA: HAD family hydrolase [Burkholderiaceae bacterium]